MVVLLLLFLQQPQETNTLSKNLLVIESSLVNVNVIASQHRVTELETTLKKRLAIFLFKQ